MNTEIFYIKRVNSSFGGTSYGIYNGKYFTFTGNIHKASKHNQGECISFLNSFLTLENEVNGYINPCNTYYLIDSNNAAHEFSFIHS